MRYWRIAVAEENNYGLRISARRYRRVKVRMSMGHEVVGHWFNEEVKDNLSLLDEVEQAARTVKGSERSRNEQGMNTRSGWTAKR